MKHTLYRNSGYSSTVLEAWNWLTEASRYPCSHRAWVTLWHKPQGRELQLVAVSTRLRRVMGALLEQPPLVLLTTNPEAEDVMWAILPTDLGAFKSMGSTRVFPEVSPVTPGAWLQLCPFLSAVLLSYPEAIVQGDDVVESTLQGIMDVPEAQLPDLEATVVATTYELGTSTEGWKLKATRDYSTHLVNRSAKGLSFGQEGAMVFPVFHPGNGASFGSFLLTCPSSSR